MTTKNVNWTQRAWRIITKHLREVSVRSNIDQMNVDITKNTRTSNIQRLEQIDTDITNAMI